MTSSRYRSERAQGGGVDCGTESVRDGEGRKRKEKEGKGRGLAGAQGRIWGWGWAGSHLPVEMQEGWEHRVIIAGTVGKGKKDVNFWCDGKLYTGKAALKSKCNPAVTFCCKSVFWKLKI